MSVTRIATRYAKSLLELAQEQNRVEEVRADMGMLQEAVRIRDLYLLLKSPIVHADKKSAILDAVFKGKLDTLTTAYLHLLVNKGREKYLPEIAAEFIIQYKVMRRITRVVVTSAQPLTQEVLDALRAKILASGATFETMEIETKVDPDLIGGFVLEFDNKRYDASLEHKLDALKAQFSKNLYIKEF